MADSTKEIVQGLYPSRTALVLLGPGANSGGNGTSMGDKEGSTKPYMATTTVHAREAEELRRRASQLKVYEHPNLRTDVLVKDGTPTSS